MTPSADPPLRITLVGFGDVGQAYAAALLEQGVPVRVFHPAPRAPARDAAARLGLAIETDPAAACRDSDLVLNVAPGSQALPTALALAPHLRAGALFADLSSAAPDALREAATHFGAAGYVDGAILGAVSIHGHRTPILASGEGAPRLKRLLEPLGFPVDVMADGVPGDATALKLVRSVLTKGMDAVVLECLLIAESLGLRHQLMAQLGDLDASPLTELMQMFVRTHAPHALRRLHEMEAIEETLHGLDVPLIMTPATKRRFARSVEMLGEGASVPSTPPGASVFDRAIPWMLEAERRHPATPGEAAAGA
jgi:3-hydroxyisobutyrate dehydrogenase